MSAHTHGDSPSEGESTLLSHGSLAWLFVGCGGGVFPAFGYTTLIHQDTDEEEEEEEVVYSAAGSLTRHDSRGPSQNVR